MWKIVEIANLTSPEQQVLLSGEGELLNVVRGPEGSSYRIIVTNKGFLDLVDTGRATNAWEININGCLFWYEGEGEVSLTFNNDGTFRATGGLGIDLTGQLKPMPTISPTDTYLLQQMIDLKLVPYQNIPDVPGKTSAEIRDLGLLFFPFSGSSYHLAYSVYDWTSASFMRNVIFKAFAYSGIVDHPLDQPTIADVIWTSNWPPYVPSNAGYMHPNGSRRLRRKCK